LVCTKDVVFLETHESIPGFQGSRKATSLMLPKYLAEGIQRINYTMPKEIERKYLLKDDSWKSGRGSLYRQGYLSRVKGRTVRVRVVDKKGYLRTL
jgi:hypothetical protein